MNWRELFFSALLLTAFIAGAAALGYLFTRAASALTSHDRDEDERS
jgi:hypothetical protein